MPSTATITSFVSFVAETKIKSAEVNSNFSNFRGHIIPIEPLTITSAHLTYDLGSVDHAWRGTYQQYGVMYQNTASALPPTPGSGFMSLYFKNDGLLYKKAPSGTETEVGVSAVVDNPYEITNLGLAASVATNALTIALKQKDGSTDPSSGSGAVKIAMRSATAATGSYSALSVTGALSIVIPSGADLAQAAAFSKAIYVYAINNAGTIELAIAGSKIFEDGSVVSTTVLDTSSDSAVTLYSTTARSNVACRLIGRVTSTQATPGTWATAPSEVTVTPFENKKPRSQVWLSAGNGAGSTNTAIRRFTTTINNVGTAITLAQSSTNGDSFTINEDGVYAISYSDSVATVDMFGISVNSNQLTTGINTITNSHRLAICQLNAVNYIQNVAATVYLSTGDVVRAHTVATVTNGSSNAAATFIITKVS